MRFGQQGTLTEVWAPRGSRPVRVRQCQYKWVYVFGAVNPQTGESVGMIAPTVNTVCMNVHLRWISEHVDPDVQIVLVMDNAAWHRSNDIEVPENITLLPLPPYSPELNPVERLWAWLKSNQLSNRVYETQHALHQAGLDAWNTLTEDRIRSVCRTEWIQRCD